MQDRKIKTDRCFSCGGSGEHECDCGDVHDCRSCEGEGHATFEMTLKEIYVEKRNQDKRRLEEWNKTVGDNNGS